MSLVPWSAHPEVWMLLLGTLALGWYTSKVLQPKAIALGYAPIARRQRVWFTLGFVGIWVASDWPVHDIAENYLYFVHMIQHLLLSMLIPACFVLATPRWLFELLVTPDTKLGGAKFAALHHAQLRDAVVVVVAEKAEIAAPVEIVHWLSGEKASGFPRTIILAGARSKVTVPSFLSKGPRLVEVPKWLTS